MQKMLPKLRLPMTSADLDMTIAKFMREKNNMEEIFVDPKQFAKNLAWHPKPGTAPGLRRALDQAKEKRAQVLCCRHPCCFLACARYQRGRVQVCELVMS
jgi:hypothetical protein